VGLCTRQHKKQKEQLYSSQLSTQENELSPAERTGEGDKKSVHDAFAVKQEREYELSG
jgi:hypothetical protein